jgi:hypothetical protein
LPPPELEEVLEPVDEELEELLADEELLELDEDEDEDELPDDPDGLLGSSGSGEPVLSLQPAPEEIRAPARRMRVNFKNRFVLFAAGKDPCLITTPVHGTTTRISGRRLLRFK